MCAWSCSWLSAHVFAVVAYEHGAVQLRHNAALSGKEVYIAAYDALRLCGGYGRALLQAKAAALAFLFKLYVLNIVVIAAQAELVAAVYDAYFLFKRGVVHIVKIKAGYFVCAVRAGKLIRLQRGVKAYGKGDKIARVYFVLVFVPVCYAVMLFALPFCVMVSSVD